MSTNEAIELLRDLLNEDTTFVDGDGALQCLFCDGEDSSWGEGVFFHYKGCLLLRIKDFIEQQDNPVKPDIQLIITHKPQ